MPPFDAIRTVEVEATFRHSAGRLGTHFLKAIRDERKFLGWRTGNPPRVMVPPKDLGGTGEWVEIGPGARLDAYAPAEWLSDGADASSCLALVQLDGADTAMLTRLKPAVAPDALPVGTRLVARFAEERHGAVTDFWFEVAP
jgi:uncharacterized OB-fold protein